MPFYNSSACALDLMNMLMRPTTTTMYQSQHKARHSGAETKREVNRKSAKNLYRGGGTLFSKI